MDGGGVQISTANGIAAIVFLVGTIGTLLGIIRGLYVDQIKDLKAEIVILKQDVKDQNEVLKRAVDGNDRFADLLERTTGVTEEVVRKVPAATRRRAAS